jgi:hypothetical protein
LDDKLARIKQLIDLKEQTDAELFALIGGGDIKSRRAARGSRCNEEGHTARNCPRKMPPATI